MLVILLFLALVQVIPAERLHRALGYVQFFLSFLFIGAFFLLSRATRALDALRLEKTAVAYLNPAAWFAAWIEIAEGRAVGYDWLAAAAPLGLLVVSGLLVRSRLSLAYADRLATMFVERPSRPATRRPVPVLIVGPAHHAVGLLAGAQFRTDQKFRLGVLGILPLTVIYLLAGFAEAEGPDLMTREPLLVYYAVLFFPVMLRQFLVYSEAWRGAWVFHAAPTPFEDLVVGLKNVVVARFLVPYLILVVALIGWLYPRPPLELLLHGLVIGLLSHALLAADLLINPSLPFSQPTRQGVRSFALLLLMAPTMVIISTVPFWRPYLYASAARAFTGLALLVVINVLLHETLLTRVARLSRHWACASCAPGWPAGPRWRRSSPSSSTCRRPRASRPPTARLPSSMPRGWRCLRRPVPRCASTRVPRPGPRPWRPSTRSSACVSAWRRGAPPAWRVRTRR
jgi:hypothetical protein